MQLQPLTDAEFERLSGILGRLHNARPMNLEQLDGFLAALICGPRLCAQANICPLFGETIWFLRVPSVRSPNCKNFYP